MEDPTETAGARNRRRVVWLATAALLAAIAGAVVVIGIKAAGHDPVGLARGVLAAVQAEVASWPGPALVAAVAVLPALGFPVSPLYLLAGARGTGFATGGIAIALLANLALSYVLARGVLRPVLAALLRRRGITIPEASPGNRVRVLMLVRLTPGLPLFIQSTILALAGLPFGLYLVGSFLLQYPIAVAMALLGDAFVNGHAGLAVGAIGLIVILVVGLRLVRERLQATRGTAPAPEEARP